MIILTGKIVEAFNWALVLHGGQKRKGTNIPYLAHLMAVASIVMEHGKDEDEVIAALLHDAAEDAGGRDTLDNIRNRFGGKVAGIVEECSDTFETPKPPYRERKEKYIRRLAEKSASAQLVSLADKLHNVRSILKDYRRVGEDLWKRFNGGRDGTLWYYDELIKKFLNSRLFESHKDLVQELECSIKKLKELIHHQGEGIPPFN